MDGIGEYLDLAESERLRMAQSPESADRVTSGTRSYGDNAPGEVINVYERLLPYAVMLGKEKEWAEVIHVAAPDVPTAHIAALSFANATTIHSLSSRLSTPAVVRAAAFSSSGGFVVIGWLVVLGRFVRRRILRRRGRRRQHGRPLIAQIGPARSHCPAP